MADEFAIGAALIAAFVALLIWYIKHDNPHPMMGQALVASRATMTKARTNNSGVQGR